MGTQIAVIDDKKFESQLQTLVQRSAALVIADADTCRQGKQLQVLWKQYLEGVGFEFDPGIAKAKGLLDHLKDQKKKWYDPGKAEMDSVRNRVDTYTEQERIRTEQERQREQAKIDAEARRVAEEQRREAERVAAEQRKVAEAQAAEARRLREKELEIQRKQGEINKRELEQAKKLEAEIAAKAKAQAALDEAKAKELARVQAEEAAKNTPQIQVKANIPSVAGTKNQVYYSAEVTNPAQIIAAYNHALLSSNLERQRFLSRFIMVNEQEVGKFARDTKDNQKATEQVPGVKFTSRG